MGTKMDHNLIQLLIWIISREITKENGSEDDDHNNVFRKICNLLSEEYNIRVNNDPLIDSRIDLALKMINFYYNHFGEGSDGDELLMNFPILNGKYDAFINHIQIAEGTYGVYRVEDVTDNHHYAVKKVPLYGITYQ
jgi:hypothetical protein